MKPLRVEFCITFHLHWLMSTVTYPFDYYRFCKYNCVSGFFLTVHNLFTYIFDTVFHPQSVYECGPFPEHEAMPRDMRSWLSPDCAPPHAVLTHVSVLVRSRLRMPLGQHGFFWPTGAHLPVLGTVSAGFPRRTTRMTDTSRSMIPHQ